MMEEVKLKEMIHNAGLQEYEESILTKIKELKKSNSEVDEEKFLPFGAIGNRRSLIYLGNLTDALRVCLTHPLAAGKVYLLSDGDDVSTAELIQRLAGALGRQARLLPIPVSWMKVLGRLVGKQAQVDRLVGSLTVDTSPIRQELEWAPPYTMKEGLARTAGWYRHREFGH